MKPPALIVVGEVVGLREKLRWFEDKPLFGKRILVTRAREQASALARRLEAAGAEVVEFPAIRIVPPESWAPLDAAIARLREYRWVIFTSANGVRFFWERLRQARTRRPRPRRDHGLRHRARPRRRRSATRGHPGGPRPGGVQGGGAGGCDRRPMILPVRGCCWPGPPRRARCSRRS